jgi:quinol monooxygenase YgiN
MTESADSRKVLYAEFTATSGNEERVAQLVSEYAQVVQAEAGNLVFSAHRKRDEPASFFVYEEYVDSAAFKAHVAAEYGESFNAALVPLIVGDGSDLTVLLPL